MSTLSCPLLRQPNSDALKSFLPKRPPSTARPLQMPLLLLFFCVLMGAR